MQHGRVEVAKLVLEYLKVVIWPVTVIGLMWFLRAHLREAFGRLTRVETPLGAADFEADARHLRERADELVLPGPGAVPEREEGSGVRIAPHAREVPEPEPSPMEGEERKKLEALEALLAGVREQMEAALEAPEEPEESEQLSGRARNLARHRARVRGLEELVESQRQRVPELAVLPRSSASESLRSLEDAAATATVSPLGGIIAAWEVVRTLAEDVLPETWVGPQAGRSRDLIDDIRRFGLPPGVVRMLSELRALKNRARSGEPVSVQGALDYVSTALTLSRELELFRRLA